MAAPDFYVAKESANFDFGGQPIFLTAGVTIVAAGHPILRDHQALFEPLRVHYDVARPEPAAELESENDPVPANPHRADQRGARSRTSTRSE
jgi:hypothetical protein